jgi:hypothetical protein
MSAYAEHSAASRSLTGSESQAGTGWAEILESYHCLHTLPRKFRESLPPGVVSLNSLRFCSGHRHVSRRKFRRLPGDGNKQETPRGFHAGSESAWFGNSENRCLHVRRMIAALARADVGEGIGEKIWIGGLHALPDDCRFRWRRLDLFTTRGKSVIWPVDHLESNVHPPWREVGLPRFSSVFQV